MAAEGPQLITRHGEDFAVIVGIDGYRRLTANRRNLREMLLGPPYFDEKMIEAMDEVEAERK